MSEGAERSVVQVQESAKSRKINKVPFVELHHGRLQGVVSSGSDIARVYVSFFDAGTMDYSCRTNNNRPCGGLRGGPCKHLVSLLDEAVLQYGSSRVVEFLKVDADPATITRGSALTRFSGSKRDEQAGVVFSRFLSYLRYIELEQSEAPMPELAWFVSA